MKTVIVVWLMLLVLAPVASAQEPEDEVFGDIVWSPNGEFIAYGCSSPLGSSVCIEETSFHASNTRARFSYSAYIPGTPIAWSPDSKYVAFGCNSPLGDRVCVEEAWPSSSNSSIKFSQFEYQVQR